MFNSMNVAITLNCLMDIDPVEQIIFDEKISRNYIYRKLKWFVFRIVEKDLYLSKDFKLELEKRLQLKPGNIKLPLIFLNGSFLGVS